MPTLHAVIDTISSDRRARRLVHTKGNEFVCGTNRYVLREETRPLNDVDTREGTCFDRILSREEAQGLRAETLVFDPVSTTSGQPRLYAFALWKGEQLVGRATSYEALLHVFVQHLTPPFLIVAKEPPSLTSLRKRDGFASAVLAHLSISDYSPRVFIAQEFRDQAWYGIDLVKKASAHMSIEAVDWDATLLQHEHLVEALAETFHQLEPEEQGVFHASLADFEVDHTLLNLLILAHQP